MMEEVTIKGFPAELTSKIASGAITKKLGVDCTLKIKEATLVTKDRTVDLYANIGIRISADDLQKLIFQGGK